MRKYLTFIFAVFFSLNANAATIGESAPEFKVKDINGNEQSIAQYKGKVIILEWNNPGCPFVQKFYDSNTMQKLQADAIAGGAVWLTVNSGAQGKQGHMTSEEAKKQLETWKAAPTAYINDEDGKIGKAYGAKTTPHMFIVDKEGDLVFAGGIDDKPTAKKEDIATAKNYVVDALQNLKDGKIVEIDRTTPYGCAVKYAE